MQAASMQISLHTPTALIFQDAAAHLYAMAENGALGLLPNHCDFVTALQPSILIVRTLEQRELFFAVDEGLLVKQDSRVSIAVQRAVQSASLDELQQLLQSTFGELDEREREARSTLSKLEASVVRRFAELGKNT